MRRYLILLIFIAIRLGLVAQYSRVRFSKKQQEYTDGLKKVVYTS